MAKEEELLDRIKDKDDEIGSLNCQLKYVSS